MTTPPAKVPSELPIERFVDDVEAARRRSAGLRERALGSAPVLQELLSEALADLESTLEELRVAGEELRLQNEELGSARQALEAERQRYQELFDLAPVAYLVTDGGGIIREVNRAAAGLLESSREFLIGKPLVLYVAEQGRQDFLLHLSRLHQTEQVQDWELRMQPRHRPPFEAELSAVAVRDSDGRPAALRWLVRDVTPRKRAEAEVRRLKAELERRVAERTAELAGEQERLRLALEAGQLRTWDWDLVTGRATWSDEAGGRHVIEPGPAGGGYTALLDDVHPEDREAVLRAIAASIEERTGYDVDYRVLRADGSLRWLEGKGRVLRDERGKAVRVIGVTLDITARKTAEQRQAAQHAVTRVLAESTGIEQAAPRILEAVGRSLRWTWGALWRVDRSRNELSCVEAWNAAGGSAEMKAFETRTRELLFEWGVGLPGRVWARAEPVWIEDVTRDANFPRAPLAARAGLHAAFAFPIVLGPQVLGVIEFFSRAILRPDEDLLDMLASVGSEIGQFMERKEAERELSALKDELAVQLEDLTRLHYLSLRLSTTLDLEPILEEVLREVTAFQRARMGVVMLHDPRRRELYSVAGVGFTPEYLEVAGRVPVTAGACGAAIARRGPVTIEDIESDPACAAELPAARLAGYRSVYCIPLFTRAGEILGTIATYFREPYRPTERESRLVELYARQAAEAIDNARLYREAQEASRAKDEFLAILSHELRAPLNAMVGWVHLLRGGRLDEGDRERALETIDRNIKLQAQLIEDLLDVSRIIFGKLRLDRRPLELAGVIDAALETVRPTAEAKGIALQTRLDPAVGRVAGDAGRLQQVFWNLLSNAVKFTPEGGRVEVRLERAGSRARVAVSDTGAGIDPELLPHVFERFRQAEAPGLQARGLGLGLAIVRHVVELHGGTVRPESVGEGRGATFTVELPLAEPEAATGAAPPQPSVGGANPPGEEAAQLRGLRVLVVDDQADSREVVATFLERWGGGVRAVGSPAEALEAIGEQWPDLLVLDIALPGEDGYELLRRIRALEALAGRKPMPAVALTAHAMEEDRRRALEAGFQRHLAKPFRPDELAEAVRGLARAAREPADGGAVR